MPTLIEWTETGATNCGERFLRDAIVPDPGWQLLLWVNDLTPDFDTIIDDLQEADFGGYSRKDIDRALWQAPARVADTVVWTYSDGPFTWTRSGGADQTVYGYAVIDPTAVEIRWVQRLDSPVPIAVGGILAVQPRFVLQTLCVCAAP